MKGKAIILLYVLTLNAGLMCSQTVSGDAANDLSKEKPVKIGNYSLFHLPIKSEFLLSDVVHRKNVLEALDVDNDGYIDLLRYIALDTDGNEIVESVDCGFDGQMDVRWHYPGIEDSSYIEIWYEDRWYTIEKEKYLHINVRGKNKEIKSSGNCFVVVETDKKGTQKGDGGN